MAAADYFSQVQKIYVAYYGRPADPAGLSYWGSRLDAAGGNLSSIINAFGTSSESTALYTGDNAAKVTAIYQQLFNRAQLTQEEIHILRGVAKQMSVTARQKG